MSKLEDSFTLPVGPDETMLACKKGVLDCGWALAEIGEDRLVPKIGAGLIRNPSKIEVRTSASDEDRTTIALNGWIFGFGPVQKRQLTGLMNELKNAIQVAAENGDPAHGRPKDGVGPKSGT